MPDTTKLKEDMDTLADLEHQIDVANAKRNYHEMHVDRLHKARRKVKRRVLDAITELTSRMESVAV